MDKSSIFTVTPMSHNINLEVGGVYEGYIILANPVNATEDFEYRVTVSPYTVLGDEYTADFAASSARTQIVDWITIENPTGTLKPNSTTKVNFRVEVPDTAPAGGQYATLLVGSNKDAGSDSGVSVNNVFEMASVIYANVAGETIRDGEVLENSIPGFVTSVPIRATALITNNGNAHEVARITLEVKSIFSSDLIYPLSGDDGSVSEVIMPETSRYVSRDINGISPLGIYEITQTIDYLGETHELKQVVVACPIWFMVLVAVTLTTLVSFFVYRIKTLRRKRRVL